MDSTRRVIELPELIPVLPVRNTVIFPNAAVPLIVGRTKSVQSVQQAERQGDLLLVVAQKDATKDEPVVEELYRIGVICLVSKVTQVEKESYQLIVNGLFRFRITEFIEGGKFLSAKGYQLPEGTLNLSPKTETLAMEVKEMGKTILNLSSIPGSEQIVKLLQQLDEPAQIADLCSTFLQLSIPIKQEILETLDVEKRLETLLGHMVREKEKLLLQNEIQTKMMERLSKDQRDHLLREQIRTLHEELGDESNLVDELSKKIESLGLPADAKKTAKEELSRMQSVPRSSPEYHVIRTYLDWLVALPWQKTSGKEAKDLNLLEAKNVLDEDHYGIEKVKKRILEHLAVSKLKNDIKGQVICLLGPPGVGKTSIAKSIAKALGRTFIRTSLGGVRDEAEIRGHRRTYIGALPGKLIQNMKRAGTKDPLMLLDEIDKVGNDFRGDPSSALLEVLDPEQNTTFMDHYLDVPFDLSKVFFITTANQIETIPSALRDRLEIIEMSSYSRKEKLEIAKAHLVPKVLAEHGVTDKDVIVPENTVQELIDSYTREAGVRQLSRELAGIVRYAASLIAMDASNKPVTLSVDKLETILGNKKYHHDTASDEKKTGVVTGLAWTPVGGEILKIEVTQMDGKGKLILTGSLGDVMKESAQIALSLLRSRLGTKISLPFDRLDYHIHVPSGAIPKDGPSAGVALFTALYSLMENKPVDSKTAMTGEITLSGNVLPVGGVKEKVLAAHRAQVRRVLIPEKNAGDINEISPDIRKEMEFFFVKDIAQVLKITGLVADTLELPQMPPPQSIQLQLPVN